MSKKIKIEAIIELIGDTHIDESMLKRTISSLGNVESCKVTDDLESEKAKAAEPKVSISTNSVSEISKFLNDANKIYFGTLSIDERKYVAASILYRSVSQKVKEDNEYKEKMSKSFIEKFEIDSDYTKELLSQNLDVSALSSIKDKFLEGDLIQMYTYIWEKVLSKGEEEDDFEIQLIESSAENFGLEKPNVNDTKKIGKERSKITKAINEIESGKVSYNKLKAFEKTVLLCMMLTECSTIDGKISPNDLKVLKSIFNNQFNITSNVMTVIIEKKLDYSITKKVEQVEVYREKYELVEFLWEKILSSEPGVSDDEMTLVRKWLRRLDISDVESEGARKEVEANLNP